MKSNAILKTGFYPACGRDVKEPLSILGDLVDRVVFCDINPLLQDSWSKLITRKLTTYKAVPEFVVGHAKDVLLSLDRLDVLFHRKDGMGEGGSGLPIFSKDWLKIITDKMPEEGGMIITDGSNTWGHQFKKILRDDGLALCDWKFTLNQNVSQPPHNQLYTISVSRQ